MKGELFGVLLTVALASACTKPNPAFCASDEDCELAATPFCDLAGEFEEANTCIERPPGCAVERCGCTAGTATCSGGELTVCNADGRSVAVQACALGCGDENRCATFTPSNDLGTALNEASTEPDIVLPAGVYIDTNSGVVMDSGNQPLMVRSSVVTQGTSSIRVFMAKSFVIDDAVIVGDFAFAAVSPGPIVVKGRVDAAATGIQHGPGAYTVDAPCFGQSSRQTGCGTNQTCAKGAGGGGQATQGGAGGNAFQPGPSGGATNSSFVPLLGGCNGGSIENLLGTVLAYAGGGGGGALQLVSLQSVTVSDFGFIDLGGGGGRSGAGGGSGGTLILEAPTVRIAGSTAGITANGGGGGGCNVNGPDSSPSTTASAAPQCGQYTPGKGGTATFLAEGGYVCSTCISEAPANYGGGGGSVGRLRVATRDGTFEKIGSPIMSIVESTATLTPQ